MDADLPENHRRGISATLGVLSQTLTRFRRWAEGGEAASALFVEENNLTQSQRSSILAALEDLEVELRDLREALRLTVKQLDVAKVIEVQCAFLWEDIEDLKGRPLRRYGEVPPDWGAYMDGKVERFVELLETIARAAHGAPGVQEELAAEDR